MILLNGRAENRITITDRGVQYGDGLFETMAYRNGRVELLNEHLTRLAKGCSRLAIAYPGDLILQADIERVCRSVDRDAVIKIIITRGEGGRGYRTSRDHNITRIVSSHPLPEYPNNYQSGIRTRLCQQTLSENSSLAGIKHLNRLEQVLARQEWDDDEISEGFMFDQHEQLIEGVMSNIFIVREKVLFTAILDKSGVAGVMRGHIINIAKRLGIDCQQKHLSLDDLKNADEVFISNSLITIWPVIQIDNIAEYAHGKITQQLQQETGS